MTGENQERYTTVKADPDWWLLLIKYQRNLPMAWLHDKFRVIAWVLDEQGEICKVSGILERRGQPMTMLLTQAFERDFEPMEHRDGVFIMTALYSGNTSGGIPASVLTEIVKARDPVYALTHADDDDKQPAHRNGSS